MAETRQRIVDGALRALARFGLLKLSLSEISKEAGVSRATLHRYFRSKDDVLEAVSWHMEEEFRAAMEKAVANRPALEHRLVVVVEVLLEVRSSNPAYGQLLQVEPRFTLDYIEREFASMLKIVRSAIDPAKAVIPVVRDGQLTVNQLAELVMRLGMSGFLIPTRSLPTAAKRLAAALTAQTGAKTGTNTSSASSNRT